MTNNVELSKEGTEFLENLRVYLFSNGKKWDEIEAIVDELETHLMEAEEKGKPIEKIIGKSPKEYMESLSGEMAIDYRNWMKYIVLILVAGFSIEVLPDVLEGSVSYSLIDLIGNIVIGIIFLALILIAFKYVSTHAMSPKMQLALFSPIVLLNIGLFGGLIYFDRAVASPVIYFGVLGSSIIGIIALLFLIGLSIWAKTWILIVVVTFMTLPDYLLGFTSITYENQLIISTLILFGGMGIYIAFVFNRGKNSNQHKSG